MAAALEGGLEGEQPGTAAFAIDSTQMLPDDEDATQALPRTTALPRQEYYEPEPAIVAPRERRPERRKRDGAARARFVALALILVLAAVAVALLVSSSGSNFTDIDAGNAKDQANELIQYVRDHVKR
jgi:hypothetical protein